MTELIEAVTSWPSLLLVLVAFGFAPGFCLRLIVLAYPRGDPRRAELIAELYAVPRIQRPLWVAEQLEVALFEGLAHRVSATLRRLTNRRRARAQTDKRGVWVRMLRNVVAAGMGCGIAFVLRLLLMDVLGLPSVLGLLLGLVLAFVLAYVLVLVIELAGRFRGWCWPSR